MNPTRAELLGEREALLRELRELQAETRMLLGILRWLADEIESCRR